MPRTTRPKMDFMQLTVWNMRRGGTFRCKLCDLIKPEPEPEDCLITADEATSLCKFLNMDVVQWGEMFMMEMWYCQSCHEKILGIHQWLDSGKKIVPEGQDFEADKIWIWEQVRKTQGDIVPANANQGKKTRPEPDEEPPVEEVMRIMEAKSLGKKAMDAKLAAEGKNIRDLSWEEIKDLEIEFSYKKFLDQVGGPGGDPGASAGHSGRTRR